MSDSKIPTPGLSFRQELTTTQVPVPAGAGATWVNSNNIVTVTTNAAHGLTLTPAAGVAPNYFIQMATAFTVTAGVGVGLNQIFRILAIPSTTTFQVYSTITTATVTSTTFVPIFFMTSQITPNSAFLNGPTMTSGGVTTSQPPMLVGGATVNVILGANCTVQYAPGDYAGSTATPCIPLDSTSGVTPSAAPTYRTLMAVSTTGQSFFPTYSQFIAASGGTGSTFWSVVE